MWYNAVFLEILALDRFLAADVIFSGLSRSLTMAAFETAYRISYYCSINNYVRILYRSEISPNIGQKSVFFIPHVYLTLPYWQLTDYLETNRLLQFYRCCSRPIGATTAPRLLCWRFCPMFWPRSTRRRPPYWRCWTSVPPLTAWISDHDILLSRLQSRFGLDGAVLAWIRSVSVVVCLQR